MYVSVELVGFTPNLRQAGIAKPVENFPAIWYNYSNHVCVAPDSQSGYRFSKAMENPAFISVDDIKNTYMPMGFSNFKIEGRGLGSALVLEFLLYYMTKPEYQIHVREEI